MTSLNNIGYLELIVGPMFSGKTKRLIEIYNVNSLKLEASEIIVVNYCQDKRYSNDKLSSHDKEMIDCTMVNELSEIAKIVGVPKEEVIKNEKFINAKLILINECQFFNDIVEWVTTALNVYKKRLYICGLDGDFNRKLFGNWLNLVPLCDKITKNVSCCEYCENYSGIFTHRKIKDDRQFLIGSKDIYIPLCRMCYENNNDLYI